MRASAALIVVAIATAAGTARGAPAAEPVLGIRSLDGGGAVVQRYDPTTLRPLGRGGRPGLTVRFWSFTPDRSRVALAGDGAGHGPSLAVLDTSTLRRRGALSANLDLGFTGFVQGVAWPRDDRLLLVTADGVGLTGVHLVDPRAMRGLAHVTLRGTLLAGATTERGPVLLLAPRQGIGAAKLVSLDSALAVREIPLTGIRAGIGRSRAGASPDEDAAVVRRPAVAADPTGQRAVVVGYEERIADIDLETGTVRYRGVAVRTLARSSKSITGPQLMGLWLGDGAVAIAGTVYGSLDAGTHLRMTPVGLRILDLRSWRTRVTDPRVVWVTRSGSDLLFMGREDGLRWYSRRGRPVGHLFPGRQVTDVAAAGRRALVRIEGNLRVAVVDLRTGAVVERRELTWPRLPLFLAADAFVVG